MNSASKRTDNFENSLLEEIVFWQRFISGHKNKSEARVMLRAAEALELAKGKLDFYRSEQRACDEHKRMTH